MKKETKIDYYDRFKCIADKCSFTCCQEWKIAVDDDTLKKWDGLSVTKGKDNYLEQYVTQKEGIPVIGLNDQKQCPFLNEEKLCKLVINYGDDVLSKTCAMFPKQIHEFSDRKEYTVVTCCPEVVDLINQQDTILLSEKIVDNGNDIGEEVLETFEKNTQDDILLQIRTMIITIMQNQKYTISKCMMMIFYCILDINQNKPTILKKIDEYTQDVVLNELSDAIDKMQFQSLNTFEENNELFLDMVENYRKQEIYTREIEPLAGLAEMFSKEYDKSKMIQQLEIFDEQFRTYEKLFRKYLIAEIFANSLMPESDLESMVVMMQWISMEYVIIRHVIFLNWIIDKQEELTYTTVRKYIVIISRIMGYKQEEIYQYLEKSFKSLLWEWGYLALIIGENHLE